MLFSFPKDFTGKFHTVLGGEGGLFFSKAENSPRACGFLLTQPLLALCLICNSNSVNRPFRELVKPRILSDNWMNVG